MMVPPDVFLAVLWFLVHILWSFILVVAHGYEVLHHLEKLRRLLGW